MMTITLADLGDIPDSTATGAREYLFTNLTNVLPADAANSASLLVCYDEPGPYEADDIVSVGNVALDYETGSFVGNGGAGWLRERYTITITIDVFRGGDNPQMTFCRAQYLSDLVAALVRYDVSLGETVITATPHSSVIESEWDDGHKGRHSVATVDISIFAQR
jgi:hypothetical protein